MSETKTNINWFPGHMAKARREMSESIKLVDLVIEIRDSRIPLSSENPLLNEIIGNKPRLIVLSKSDKSEQKETDKWIAYFNEKGMEAVSLNLVENKNVANIISNKCQLLMKEKINKLKAKGLRHYEIKAMVVGIPNVGKSTLINSVSRKKVAKTADKPGVTKNLQWIKVSSDVALLDTPGVLWPKFEDEKVGIMLALTGAINDVILPIEEIVHFAVEFLLQHHPEKLENRYGIKVQTVIDTIDEIGKVRGCLTNENELDYKRINALILKDIRDNQLGPISWEIVDESK